MLCWKNKCIFIITYAEVCFCMLIGFHSPVHFDVRLKNIYNTYNTIQWTMMPSAYRPTESINKVERVKVRHQQAVLSNSTIRWLQSCMETKIGHNATKS